MKFMNILFFWWFPSVWFQVRIKYSNNRQIFHLRQSFSELEFFVNFLSVFFTCMNRKQSIDAKNIFLICFCSSTWISLNWWGIMMDEFTFTFMNGIWSYIQMFKQLSRFMVGFIKGKTKRCRIWEIFEKFNRKRRQQYFMCYGGSNLDSLTFISGELCFGRLLCSSSTRYYELGIFDEFHKLTRSRYKFLSL